MSQPGPAIGRAIPLLVSRGLARFADWIVFALVVSIIGQISLWVVLFVAITALAIYPTALLDHWRRRWHDKLAGTIVVKG